MRDANYEFIIHSLIDLVGGLLIDDWKMLLGASISR